MAEETLKVVTLVKHHSLLDYVRATVFEFKGITPVAWFVRDLGCGFYDYEKGKEEAKKMARELGLHFVEGISMGTSIDVYWNEVLK